MGLVSSVGGAKKKCNTHPVSQEEALKATLLSNKIFSVGVCVTVLVGQRVIKIATPPL